MGEAVPPKTENFYSYFIFSLIYIRIQQLEFKTIIT